MPAPTLDGTNSGTASGTTTVAAALTTTGTNRIACAMVYLEHGNADHWLTGVAGGGLTWQKRTQATLFLGGQGSGETLELWWAVAPTTLSAVTITATANASFDDAAMLVFGVAGCNTTNPWDANISLAARQFNTVTASFSNISTTQANDFLIFGRGSNGNDGLGTVPAGFTAIGSRTNTGGSAFANVSAAYLGVTATQSSQTYAWGSTMTGAVQAAIFDALTADTGGSITTPRPTFEGIAYKTGTANTSSVTIDTAGISANNVIVLLSYAEAGSAPIITTISGGGLSWTQHVRSHGSNRGSLEVWYAKVTGTLAATTLTITYAATFDNASVAVLSMVGCDASVWDANASLPKALSNTAGGAWTPSVSGISTSQAHDMVMAMTASTIVSGAGVSSVPAGFVPLAFVYTGVGGTFGAGLGIGIQIRATTQSGATITWGSSIVDPPLGSSGGEYVIAALTADAPVVASTQGARAMVLA